jgi:hypothetical protein
MAVRDMSGRQLPKGVMAAPLEHDRPHAVSGLISGGVLFSLGVAISGLLIAYALMQSPNVPAEWFAGQLVCPSLLMVLSLIWIIPGGIGAIRRKQTLHPKTRVPREMQPLRGIRWPIRRFGVFQGWETAVTPVVRSGYRAVLPLELSEWAAITVIPAGLLEPATLQSARPETGCRTSVNLVGLVVVVLILGPLAVFSARAGVNSVAAVGVLFILLACVIVAIIRAVIQLPSMQRRLVGVPLLGRWARGGIRQLGAVAGPGWIRLGDRVWEAERDLLLIRLRGRHTLETSLEVMLAGKPGRLRFIVAGASDPMMLRLWSAWMCPDVRPDLAMTELAAAAK